ncbi:MAG: sigma 54-interacting transcriptional regulator, partial [Planctomycetales bacterium]|nr:sigma 54-interacting transcriptional regulator [Planctomycetales bacterium]
MPAFLRMQRGPQMGGVFPLESSGENRLGRGLDCQITLTDPLSSRIHAVIEYTEGMWWLRDAESRNGTYVNGQKVDDAQLSSNDRIRIGSTEFSFYIEHDDTQRDAASMSQTIVLDKPVTHESGTIGVEALRDAGRAEDFLLLYQLSIRLLGCDDPNDVVRITLDLLQERTRASVVGFMWLDETGSLRPKLVLPEDQASKVRLSKTLTDVVCRQNRAIWIANQSVTGRTDTLSHFADAICVPLLSEGTTLGAIHIYQDHGRFREADLEVAVSVANILVVGLTRAQQHASLRAEHDRLVSRSGIFDEMIGDSPAMRELKGKIERIGRASGCVLVRGESGVGKELVARALHRASPRADRPMLSVNCAAIPRDLMESQLFGHKRGAFTGADNDHAGWFQQADTGTLFLDEVGDMPMSTQIKLLRVLEERQITRVGDNRSIDVNVRVIAATNKDLEKEIEAGKFRSDLYYRLKVVSVHLSPLAARREDIIPLADFFRKQANRRNGKQVKGFSPELTRWLFAQDWKGNVRQLKNVVESMVVLDIDDVLDVDDISPDVQGEPVVIPPAPPTSAGPGWLVG